MLGKKKSHTKVTFDQHTGKTSLVAEGVRVKGDIKFVGGLQIDGHVEGNLDSLGNADALVRVSESGVVIGEIRAPNVVINGKVKGNVFSDGHVELGESCIIEGTVYYTLIEVMIGAQVNGSLVHQSEEVNSRGGHLPSPDGEESSSDRFGSHGSENGFLKANAD